jgi:hypothetical protein
VLSGSGVPQSLRAERRGAADDQFLHRPQLEARVGIGGADQPAAKRLVAAEERA